MAVAEDLAGLLAAGERAAFHGRPAAGVAPLQQAVEMAHAAGRDDEATAAAWLLGVALGAAGRYGSALGVLEPLADRAAVAHPARRLFASLAASTAASVHRQLGSHTAARTQDIRAEQLASDAAEALFDAWLGLAADAVGLGDADDARSRLEQATGLLEGRPDWWRQKVRALWVRAEVALLSGDPAAACKAADGAVTLAEGSGAPRHVAKGLLFLGVAQVQGGEPGDAADTLRRAATLAERLGCLPLVWPSRAVLGALLEGTEPAESARNLASARNAVITIADDLTEDLRDGWLARPDVAALMGG
jgi:tetratricopeptide (TPR) repeat protein